MKKLLILIIILSLNSCRYFNVSPVNGISTKNLTEQPKKLDFVGTWEIDKFSYETINEMGYNFKKTELNFKLNGKVEAKNLPSFIKTFSENKTKDFLNMQGTWNIGKDFDDEKWILFLDFKNSKSKEQNFGTEFELFKENEKLILWYFIGDPDSGERLLFKKKTEITKK